ncbi:hypothetical protein LBMAG42_21570 [Deltaproteobacteria bacterium]|nr:hypothetical protein LBMAG42_21570 [Deltaproteobacteria bacterium]
MNAKRGSTAIEFSLILPVLLLLLAGIIDWAWFLFQQAAFVVATAHGARLAAGLAGETDPTTAATTEVRAWLDAFAVDGSGATVAVLVVPDGLTGTVHVSATLAHDPLFGLAGTPAQMGATADGVYYGGIYAP